VHFIGYVDEDVQHFTLITISVTPHWAK